ncbi:hypothetical protein BaRGS_00000100 [Batillaria attramentaria]|uniref:Uncharacterized protein n=1 Tax=Batillaria attramentaria TaxID=370345 RepID=A0ABD0M9J9_9CAEN
MKSRSSYSRSIRMASAFSASYRPSRILIKSRDYDSRDSQGRAVTYRNLLPRPAIVSSVARFTALYPRRSVRLMPGLFYMPKVVR